MPSNAMHGCENQGTRYGSALYACMVGRNSHDVLMVLTVDASGTAYKGAR